MHESIQIYFTRDFNIVLDKGNTSKEGLLTESRFLTTGKTSVSFPLTSIKIAVTKQMGKQIF